MGLLERCRLMDELPLAFCVIELVYADVALNGTKRIVRDFSPEIGRPLAVHCYQPAPGHCACILIPE